MKLLMKMLVIVAGVLLLLGSAADGAGDKQAAGRADVTAAVTKHTELTGTVVKAESTSLFVEHRGAVVALKIDPSTDFIGAEVTSAKDLVVGQQVRANLSIKGITNHARTIELVTDSEDSEAGVGGSGEPTAPKRLPEERLVFPPDIVAPERYPFPHEPGIPLPDERDERPIH